ncbi:type VI secretion system baseplate subunit TssG [Kangiella marina]
MNDLTVNTVTRFHSDHPYAIVFGIEQAMFREGKTRVLDGLEKGRIKFVAKQTLNPHEHSVQSYQKDESVDQYRVVGSLLNLTGANGIMPNHYSETLAKTLRDNNTVFKDFLDMFNHRLSSLMYRSWAKYRFDTDRVYQRAVKQYQSSIDVLMSSLAGISFFAKDHSATYFSGLTFNSAISAEKLKNIVAEVSGLEVSINEFKGKWIELAEEDLSRLGRSEKKYNQLGVSTMLGRRCWDIGSGFEVEFKVEDKATFKSLNPGGSMNQALTRLLKQLVGSGFEINYKLKVKASHCEPVVLSKEARTTSLGANAWMGKNTSHHRMIDYYC